MTDDQDKDQELEQYLDGDSKPSRAYAELDREMPPPDLDARILAAAEREVKVTGIDTQRSPPFKAFAWAAIVVLSFSLVLNIVFDEAVREPATEFDGILEEKRSLTAARDNGIAQNDSAPARQLPLKARRDQPADLPTDFDRAQPAQSAEEMREQEVMFASERKRESAAEARFLGEALMELSQDGRVAKVEQPVASAAVSVKPPPEVDESNREQVVQVLQDYSASSAKSADSAPREEPVQVQESPKRFTFYETLRSAEVVVERDPEVELAKILEAFDAERDDEAFLLLKEFRETYPDHPVTTVLAERGL
jgi:hypothetical protein